MLAWFGRSLLFVAFAAKTRFAVTVTYASFMLLLLTALIAASAQAYTSQFPVSTGQSPHQRSPILDGWALNPTGDAAVYRTCRPYAHRITAQT